MLPVFLMKFLSKFIMGGHKKQRIYKMYGQPGANYIYQTDARRFGEFKPRCQRRCRFKLFCISGARVDDWRVLAMANTRHEPVLCTGVRLFLLMINKCDLNEQKTK